MNDTSQSEKILGEKHFTESMQKKNEKAKTVFSNKQGSVRCI